jgi:maltose alpha-D-glucosyltransferase/alpha-amylase
MRFKRFTPILAASLSFLLLQQSALLPLALADETNLPVSSAEVSTPVEARLEARQIPSVLAKNIEEAITQVYGEENAGEIYDHVLEIIARVRKERPQALVEQDFQRSSDWYKDEVVYMFYADEFGVKTPNGHNTFQDLIEMLPYLKKLGVTTIYILPFLDSPMGDAGFDVRDPKSVRADLGGMNAFQAFATAAREQGFKLKADLILNHFSDQHRWFQEALSGDEEKMNYFIVTDKMPEARKYNDPQRGWVVDYKEPDGSISSRRLIFPDISENHYRKQTINGKDYYFYHTFYPFQPDINWKNPKVLYEVLDVIGFWENQGIDIFRMDAIPYFIKQPGTDGENLPQTHAIVKLLSSFVQAVGPRSVIQAEACQWPKDILPYFGKEETYPLHDDGTKTLTRTNEVQIAYNFPYMPALWASMITGDNSHFWNAYNSTPAIPDSAAWATFLRVHDELTLEMVDIKTRELLYNALLPKGAEFRKGLGVSGRMANFLDKNPDRIRQAFSILLSMPGVPIIYYGDEIGALNNWDYAKAFAKQRETTQKEKNANLEVISYFDSRDINRGPVLKSDLYKAAEKPNTFGGQIFKAVQHTIELRKANPALTRGTMERINADQPGVLSYLRSHPQQNVLVVHNLSGKATEATLSIPRELLSAFSASPSLMDLQSGQLVSLLKTETGLKLGLKPYQSLWLWF